MKIKCNAKKINWEVVKTTYIEQKEWKQKVKELLANGVTQLDIHTSNYATYNHIMRYKGYWCVHDDDGFKKYLVIKELDNLTPKNGFNIIKDKFKAITNIDFTNAFGYVPKNFWKLRACVPAQIGWANPSVLNMVVENCYKADVSSAFPYEESKTLPNWNDKKIVGGWIEPDEEYPFAFYSNGTLAIYNELHTEIFYSSCFYYTKEERELYADTIAEEYNYPQFNISGNFTILCKASKYNLYSVLKTLYDDRLTNPENKGIMNKSIGYCWMKRCPQYLHIAAVVIARCNKRMIDIATTIALNGDKPLLIATDSVAWQGKPNENLWTTTKDFGSFTIEHQNAKMIISGPKVYQIQTDTQLITKWAGVEDEKKKMMKFGDIIGGQPEYEKLGTSI